MEIDFVQRKEPAMDVVTRADDFLQRYKVNYVCNIKKNSVICGDNKFLPIMCNFAAHLNKICEFM